MSLSDVAGPHLESGQAQIVMPAGEPASTKLKEYILAELRCALLRTQTAAAEIKAIGLALTDDLITPLEAATAARSVNAMHLGAPVPIIDTGDWSLAGEAA